jgi:hypothetical protein
MTISNVARALAFIAICVTSSHAWADDDPRPKFAEGRALMDIGRYAEAAAKFEESLAIRATAGASLNLGDCYEKLGRYVSAVAAFDRAQEIATAAGEQGRADEAAARSARLRPMESKIWIRRPLFLRDGAASIDGVAAKFDMDIPVDGGEHVVRVSAPCKATFETRISLGLREDIRTVVPSLADGTEAGCPGAPKVMTANAPVARAAWTARHTVAAVVGAVGVVGLGLGAGFGLDAQSKQGDLESACSSYPRGCPGARRSELDGIASDADQSATISTVAFVAGAVLIVGAATLWLTSPRAQRGNRSGQLARPILAF